MNILRVSFRELYERHSCRHSQYGINVIHIAAVFGIYLALAGIVAGIVHFFGGSSWLLLSIILLHLAIVALNVPVRVLAGCLLFMALFFTGVLYLPTKWEWMCVYVLAIPLLYKIQAWSHKVYNIARDMTEFNKKYKKGFLLFMLLSVYELPLLLNYLIYDKNNWPSWIVRLGLVSRRSSPAPLPKNLFATRTHSGVMNASERNRPLAKSGRLGSLVTIPELEKVSPRCRQPPFSGNTMK